MTICCAGHPLPLILRSDGSVESAGKPGSLLGIFPDPELSDQAIDLLPGDAVVMFTDGVIEERLNGHVFGREGLVSVLERCAGQSAEDIAETIQKAVLGFGEDAPRDDIAILVGRVSPVRPLDDTTRQARGSP
jgi:serine phosphatase RsbU (regulator of sigma subunit)